MADIDCATNYYDPYPPMKSKAKRTMCFSFKKENCLSIIEDGERSSYSIPDEVCNYPSSVPECFDYLSLTPLRYSQTHDAYIFDLSASVKTWQVHFCVECPPPSVSVLHNKNTRVCPSQTEMDWDNSQCSLDGFKDEMRILRHVSECRDPSSSSSSSSDMFYEIHRGQKSERPLNRAILSFFGTYGTHFMTKAIYGAKCSQTFTLPKNLQIEAYPTFFSHVAENQPSFVRWTGRHNEEETGDSRLGDFMALDLSSIPFEIVDIDCDGSIYASEERKEACPFVRGEHLSPVMLSAEWTPIWELHILMARLVYSEKCASLLAEKMNKVFMGVEESKKKCGKEICDGNGLCSFDEIVWTDDWIYEGM